MADIESNIKVNIDTSDALSQLKLLQQQISAFQQAMRASGAANAQAAAQMQQNLMSSINATGKFRANIQTIKTSAESFTEALEKNKLSIGEYFRYAGGASKTFGKLFKQEFATINQVAKERVKELQTQYIKLGRDANGALKAIAVKPLALDMDSLATKTQIAAQRQQLFNQLMKQGSTQLLNFGKNTQWAGRQLMVGFTIPLTLLGTAASKAYMQIEQASIKFKRVYGDLNTTTTETNKMVKSVQALANEFTKYGLAVADTMNMAAEAAAMGKTGADLIKQIDQAAKLSVLGGVDQSQALATTISLTDAFKVSTDDLSKSIDFLNAVENQTALSIEDLTIAIPKAAPVVKQLGGDVKDLSFFLTAMKEGGINASEGANALKSGLASLINPSQKASDFVGKLGININGIVEANKGDIKGTVIGFAKALDTLDPLNRARAIEQMFGKFQFSRLSTLFQNVIAEGSQAQTVASLANQTTEELAILSERELKRVSDSPMFKFQKSIQDMQAKLAPVGEAFLKAVTPIVEFVSKILDGFNNLSDGAKNFITILVTVVGGIGPVLLMTFGLIANGVANIMKLFTNLKGFINKTTKPSDILGEQTQYMTTEQLRAAAIAASLDQAHSKLRQTFTSEAAAVQALAAAYRDAVAAQGAFAGTPGIPTGGAGTVPKKYANGVSMVPGPTGAGDIVPALLSPGEAVIPAKSAQKYAPVIRGMIAGNLPGFEDGTPGAGMRQSTIGPLTLKQTEGLVRTGKTMKEISDEVAAGPYGQTPPTNYGTQISPTTGHSFPAFGVGGVYEKPDGTKVFVKPQMDLVSAMAEIRGTTIARDAHGLISPEQALRVMMDPTDPENKRKFLVLESALDARLADAPKTFTKDQYFKQLVASLLRGDKDLGVGNLGGDVLADVGTAGVFQTASGKRQLGGKINSMEEQAIINLLGVKGGAKKFFAESTANIAKSMSPAEYDAAMKAEIQAVMPRLQATIAGFGNLSPEEKKAYMDMQQRLQAGMGVDWAKYQVMHSGVKPREYSMGTPSVRAEQYQSMEKAERERLYQSNIGKLDDGDINDWFGLQDTHIVSSISDPRERNADGSRKSVPSQAQLEQISAALGTTVDPAKLGSSGFEILSNATARMITKVNQRMKVGNTESRLTGTDWATVWQMFGNKFNKLALVSNPGTTKISGNIAKVMQDFDNEIVGKARPLGEVTDQSLSDVVDEILRENADFGSIAESRNRVGTMRFPVPEGMSANEAAYLSISQGARINPNTATVTADIFEGDGSNGVRMYMINSDGLAFNKKWWASGNPQTTLNDAEIGDMDHYVRNVLGDVQRQELWSTENQSLISAIREQRNPRLQRPQVTTGFNRPSPDGYRRIREAVNANPGILNWRTAGAAGEQWFTQSILPILRESGAITGEFKFRDRGIASGDLTIPANRSTIGTRQPSYDDNSLKKEGNQARFLPVGNAIENFNLLKRLSLFRDRSGVSGDEMADTFFEHVARYAKGGIVPGGTGKPKASVFDVDDTLLDLASFMPAHQERNAKLPKEQRLNWWEEVAKDPKGIPAAIQRLKEAQMRGNKILLMTARPKSYDEVTIDTLRKLGIDMNGVKLISRESKDYRKPEQMKYDKTSKYSQWYDIEEFYDDMAKTRGAVSLLGINAINPLKLANGVFSVPGPKGAGDVVPAMLSPGEAVIPAKQAAQHRPMIKQMIAGNVPGYNKGGIIPGYEEGTDEVKGNFIERIANSLIAAVKKASGAISPKILTTTTVDKESNIDAEQKLLDKEKEITKLSRQQLEEQISLSNDVYAEKLKEQQRLKAHIVMNAEQKAKYQQNEQEMLATEQEFMSQRNIELKKESGLKKAFTRNKFTGAAQGAMYGATGLVSTASMIPGVDKFAQAALPAIGAVTGAMSMIPGPAGMVVGGLLAVATIAQQLDAHFKALREEAAKSVRALGASNEAMKGFAEFAKKVSAKEIMDKRREEAVGSFFFIKPGKKTFGESYMESEKGKELTTATASALKSQDTKSAAALITSQMSTAIISNLLTPEEARSVVANLGKQIKNNSFAIDINSKITSFFGPDGKPLDFANNTIKIAMEAVVAVSADNPTGTANDGATSGGAVNEAMISAMNSIQASQDALALNTKATQEEKDALAETSKTALTDIFNKIQSSSNKGNLNEAAITAVEAAYKGSGLEERAKEVAERVKNSDSLYDQSQEIFINQMLASKNLGVTQGLTATNLGIGGADLVELLQTNAVATNQLLSVAGSMSPEQGQLLVESQVGKTSAEIASAASAIGLAQKTTGVYNMDEAQKQSVLEYYVSEEGLKKAQELQKQFTELDKNKTITIDTIVNAVGNNTALKNAMKNNKFKDYFDNLKDKKNKLIYTTQFTSLFNIPDAKLKPAIINYISEKYKDKNPKNMSDTEILTYKIEYAAYEANRVTEAGALEDLTVDPNADTGAEKSAPQASILDPYVKMLREGANYAQKLTVGWTASYNALSKYGTKAINQMAGIASLMKQYGGDAGIINDFLGGTEEEQNRIIDKTTGKLKAGAGQLIAKMKQIKDMQEFGLSYVLASPAERMAKDNELYQAGLDVIGNKEKKINEKYDKRVKALDEIGKLQDKNNQQQQDTLTLADALSKGDIAAAARAAMTAKQNSQKRALEEAKESIELARKQELQTITTTILGKTVTRAELEAKIEVNSGKIAEHKRIELNRQIDIGKNALIAAKASADQLRTGKLIAGLPKGGGGSGTGSGGTTPTGTTPTGTTPTGNQTAKFSLSKFNTAKEGATAAGLEKAKGVAETALQKSKDAITKKFKGISSAQLDASLASGNYQAIYAKLKPAEQNEFISMFTDAQTKLQGVRKYDFTPGMYGGDITSSEAGQEAKAAIMDTIPQAIKDAASLLGKNKDDGRGGPYQLDIVDYDDARRAYIKKRDSYKETKGLAWNQITPGNKTFLQKEYDAFQAQEQEVRGKLKETNSARTTLTEFMTKAKVIGKREQASFLNQYFAGWNYNFDNESLTPVDGSKDFMSWKHYAMGGMVVPKGYARGGGIYGTDTVPAMLTPGEFVIKKSAVDSIGSDRLNAMNSGNALGESVYNYSITVNANSSDASGIADAVLREIQRIDSRRIRSSAI